MAKLTISVILILLVLIGAYIVWIQNGDSVAVTEPKPKIEQSALATETPTTSYDQPAESKTTDIRKPSVPLPDFTQVQAGDPLAFYIPHEDQGYEGIVEQVSMNTSGSKSVIGNFIVDGSNYRFVFTVGQQFTFGTLHTPKGRYQLEGTSESASLVSTADINRTRDFSKPDYIIPDAVRPQKNKEGNRGP